MTDEQWHLDYEAEHGQVTIRCGCCGVSFGTVPEGTEAISLELDSGQVVDIDLEELGESGEH